MTYDEVVDMIKRHEGFSEKLYLDTVGVLTGGWGHAFFVGDYIPFYIWEKILWLDIKKAYDDLEKLKLNDDLDEVRKAVIVDMLFNLGLTNFLKFKKLIAALRNKDYEEAAKEMENSKWAKQVKSRATELIKMMRTGEV